MLKKLAEISAFTAGDLTRIQEILHPRNDNVTMPFSLAHASLAEGESSLPHRLLNSAEIYFILEGKGEMHLNEETFMAEPGDTIYIPPDALQWICNKGKSPLKFLCIVTPAWTAENEWVAEKV